MRVVERVDRTTMIASKLSVVGDRTYQITLHSADKKDFAPRVFLIGMDAVARKLDVVIEALRTFGVEPDFIRKVRPGQYSVSGPAGYVYYVRAVHGGNLDES